MLHAKMDVFFRVPKDNNRRVLHPATLVSTGAEGLTAEVGSEGLRVEPSQDLLLYYQVDNKFVQRPICVEGVLESEGRRIVSFVTTGDAVSAESRQCYRVATVIAGVTASVGSETRVPVNDVSATGFSIVSGSEYTVGTSVPVTMVHEGKKYTGTACVQSIRELQPGKNRYGLFCLSGKVGGGNLAQGLAQISMAMQRAQLRRMAGA
ncbi:MAG TPA: hypothetical protein PKE29_13360 [Phycisphaerales bacterium]|nr:hypothetical protein [Phycisphaerales bacterium]